MFCVDVIPYPRPNVNGGLDKLPSKFDMDVLIYPIGFH